jgi:hypothetical protein
MAIRNGVYLNEDSSVKPEFYDLVDLLEQRLHQDMETTTLPKDVDMDKVDDLLIKINSWVLNSEVR